MTQEDKELLLKDLCARLPYGTKAELHGEVCTVLGYFDDFVMLTSNTPLGQQTNIANIKLYLRPMSSMTEEERDEFRSLGGVMSYSRQHDHWALCAFSPEGYDWLNEHHFDYRGLIEKGLAIEAPERMYKEE